MADPLKEIERQLWADRCRHDFWTFARFGFGIANYCADKPDQAWFSERLHKPLCDWFQWHVMDWIARRGRAQRRRKLMIVWPRGFGKTTLITKAGQMWMHLKDPDLATITDSVTQTKSVGFQGTIKSVLEGGNPYAWWPSLYGNWVGSERWNASELVHAARRMRGRTEPSFGVSSVEVGLTGWHPDAVFIDDPVTKEKLREGDNWHKLVDEHVDALIPVVPPNGMIVAVATRYADMDWLGRYMRDEGIRSVDGMRPRDERFMLDPTGQWDLFMMRARTDFGDPVLPEVWGAAALDDYERKNPMEFAAQMMNEPGTGEHMPLVKEQIDAIMIERKDVPSGLRYSIHLDTAFKDRESLGRGDFSVIQVWGHDTRGNVYYWDGKRSNAWRDEDFCDAFVAMLQKLRDESRRVFMITYDKVIGQPGTFKNRLMSACHEVGIPLPPTKEINRAGKRKEVRIREAAGFWADGRVRLVRGANAVEALIGEMLRIGVWGRAPNDMADAGADVFDPDVYKPEAMANAAEQSTYRTVRPWDDELKRGSMTWSVDYARAVYDTVEGKLDNPNYRKGSS